MKKNLRQFTAFNQETIIRLLKNRKLQRSMTFVEFVIMFILMAKGGTYLTFSVVTTCFQLAMIYSCDYFYLLKRQAESNLFEGDLLCLDSVPHDIKRIRGYSTLCCLCGLAAYTLSLVCVGLLILWLIA